MIVSKIMEDHSVLSVEIDTNKIPDKTLQLAEETFPTEPEWKTFLAAFLEPDGKGGTKPIDWDSVHTGLKSATEGGYFDVY